MKKQMFLVMMLYQAKLWGACDPSKQACLSNPEGIFNNDKSINAVNGMSWLLSGIAIVGTLVFLLNAGKKLNEQDYAGSVGPFIGSMLCGISSYLAFNFLS